MSVLLRFTGPLAALDDADLRALLQRESAASANVTTATADIIAAVRTNGDRALLAMARALDGVELSELEVRRATVDRALERLAPNLREALQRAASNIAAVHRAFMPTAIETSPEPGIVIGRRPDPLDRVGVYAPGGRAAYPSSVLMAAIPARIAGVREVILCSPPQANGLPSDVVLAAAALAGVDRVFAIGGAGAIAAMALGTESIPRVDRIVGPGNAYVAEAKTQLSGVVGIDSPAGPSELLVIADDSARPERVAIELIAQAEHDPMACVVAITLSDELARAVMLELDRLVPDARRYRIVQDALAARGAVLVARDLNDAVEFSNRFAPEHLLLAVRNPDDVLTRVRSAGTVFIGDANSVAYGDYSTGANHVLPTGGSARWCSGLSPLDFVRFTTWQRVSDEAATALAGRVELLANAEGLPAHAAAARAAAGSLVTV